MDNKNTNLPENETKKSSSEWINSKNLTRYLLAFVILMVAYVRLRLLCTPLERDEGEYAYIGQLILKGIAPFKNAYTMKLPGTPLMYALNMLLFGQTITGIHIGLLIANLISIILLFVLAKRWLKSESKGCVAAALFAVASVSPGVYGFAAHATQFVVLFASDRCLPRQQCL